MSSTNENPASADALEEAKGSATKLLARFTELAPAEWDAYLSETGEWVMLQRKVGVRTNIMIHGDDMQSAEALVFLWDYLRENGYALQLMQADDGFYADVLWPGDLEDQCVTLSVVHCETRIEVVIRACISLWTADQYASENGSEISRESSTEPANNEPIVKAPKEEGEK